MKQEKRTNLAYKYRLSPSKLRVKLSPQKVPFRDSKKAALPDTALFQKRAYETLELALKIKHKGYNVYLAGEQGIGRTYFVTRFLKGKLAETSPPKDWIYVYNFDNPDRPRAISLPAGKGRVFKRKLQQAINTLRESIPLAFEQENFIKQHDNLVQTYQNIRDTIIDKMEEEAQKDGFSLNMEEDSLTLYPLWEGKVLTPEEFEQLEPELRKKLRLKSNKVMEVLINYTRKMGKKEEDFRKNEQALERKVALKKINAALSEVEKEFSGFSALRTYLESLKKDILENLEHFKNKEAGSVSLTQELLGNSEEDFFERYRVNLFVDNAEQKTRPIIVEDNPNYFNLLGCIERETELGTYYTDFTLLKSGSLHRANGGFLILKVEDILSHPLAWEGLLRALKTGFLTLEDPGDQYDLIRTKTIEPEPIPLDVKVILIGSDDFYELLYIQDDRFPKLFKLKAHMQDTVARTEENIANYLYTLANIGRENQLLSFSKEALAELVDFSSRLSDDQQKMSLNFATISELMIEASTLAQGEGKKRVDLINVKRALKNREYRLNLYEQEFMEDYDRELIKVQTSGTAVGRANGLSVVELGDYIMALPHQISCTIGVGHGGIIDLEREAELGGPIHTKGMMILKSYLQNLFAQDKPLVLSGSLCFEQSYAHIDGDSASGAELVALLSALSGIPVKLSLAFTGAISQSGQIMAVGAVSRKIEGFFDVCQRRGLTGEQGVIIPRDNVVHLMLREDVIEAVKSGLFHVYAVSNIEEALEILTGRKPGQRLSKGGFSPGSIYAAVDKKLRELAYLADKKVVRKRK
ncbi:MAG: ATP-binding protein [Desulfonauticus sp.]|nr:ATP-binding protein [Desulfonauticus sp.]